MDIVRLGEMLDRNEEVENLMFEAARKVLAGLNSAIEELGEEWRQSSGADIIQERLASLRSAIDDREHWLELFGALINDWNGTGDPLFDWSAVDRVRAKRREIVELFSGSDEAQPEEPAPRNNAAGERRRGAPPTRRPEVQAGILQSIKAGRYTEDELRRGSVKKQSLAVEFKCSRTVIDKALNEILRTGETAGS